MAYKCSICGGYGADSDGGVCKTCAEKAAPAGNDFSDAFYADTPARTPKRSSGRKILLNGGAGLSDLDPYGNHIPPSEPQADESSADKPAKKRVRAAKPRVKPSGPLAVGVIKNISAETRKKSVVSKWIRSMFSGIPFNLDDSVITFQVFPNNGKAFNALGNPYDDVIVYGKPKSGRITDGIDAEVYGRRDQNGGIVAKKIVDRSSGAVFTPAAGLGQSATWFITLSVILLISALIASFGVRGVIWAVVIAFCVSYLPLIIRVAVSAIRWISGFFGKLFGSKKDD